MNITCTNKNYAAVVVNLQKFVDLPNCDNVKAALIFGNSVIVGKDSREGDKGLFFPVECQISKEFLSANNLYRKPESGNVDPNKKGFFEEHGRVKAVKFRGHKSEGFFIPITALNYLIPEIPGMKFGLTDGLEFNEIEGHLICTKYVPKRNPMRLGKNHPKTAKVEDRIVEGQFRLHYDTENLRRNIFKIQPDDYISISSKWHGTSAVFSNLLVKRDLKWHEKLLKRLGVAIQDTHYGLIWSSRLVVKDVEEAKENSNHFYSSDIWGVVAKEVEASIPKGFTLYGEIVGYTPEGSAIQSLNGKAYHYGCKIGEHKFLVYRVTSTNPDGHVTELNWLHMKSFCQKYGLEMVKELYYGRAFDLYARIINVSDIEINGDVDTVFGIELLAGLEREYAADVMCQYNGNEVPAEGIVLRRDNLEECESWKLKSFLFTSHESKQLDGGIIDLETEQTISD